MKTPRQLPRRSGVVLLLALLLMAAIVSSTIAIATAVSNSSHQSKNLDDFLIASLAADSGLERGLGIIKLGRTMSTIANSTTVAGTSNQAVAGAGSATMTVSGGPSTSTFTIAQLRPLDSVAFDYIGYDAFGSLSNVPNSVNLTVLANAGLCTVPPASGASCRGQLEVDWVALDTNGQPAFTGRTSPAMLTTSVLNGLALVVVIHC